jgi:hypothetical protein
MNSSSNFWPVSWDSNVVCDLLMVYFLLKLWLLFFFTFISYSEFFLSLSLSENSLRFFVFYLTVLKYNAIYLSPKNIY